MHYLYMKSHNKKGKKSRATFKIKCITTAQHTFKGTVILMLMMDVNNKCKNRILVSYSLDDRSNLPHGI